MALYSLILMIIAMINDDFKVKDTAAPLIIFTMSILELALIFSQQSWLFDIFHFFINQALLSGLLIIAKENIYSNNDQSFLFKKLNLEQNGQLFALLIGIFVMETNQSIQFVQKIIYYFFSLLQIYFYLLIGTDNALMIILFIGFLLIFSFKFSREIKINRQIYMDHITDNQKQKAFKELLNQNNIITSLGIQYNHQDNDLDFYYANQNAKQEFGVNDRISMLKFFNQTVVGVSKEEEIITPRNQEFFIDTGRNNLKQLILNLFKEQHETKIKTIKNKTYSMLNAVKNTTKVRFNDITKGNSVQKILDLSYLIFDSSPFQHKGYICIILLQESLRSRVKTTSYLSQQTTDIFSNQSNFLVPQNVHQQSNFNNQVTFNTNNANQTLPSQNHIQRKSSIKTYNDVNQNQIRQNMTSINSQDDVANLNSEHKNQQKNNDKIYNLSKFQNKIFNDDYSINKEEQQFLNNTAASPSQYFKSQFNSILKNNHNLYQNNTSTLISFQNNSSSNQQLINPQNSIYNTSGINQFKDISPCNNNIEQEDSKFQNFGSNDMEIKIHKNSQCQILEDQDIDEKSKSGKEYVIQSKYYPNKNILRDQQKQYVNTSSKNDQIKQQLAQSESTNNITSDQNKSCNEHEQTSFRKQLQNYNHKNEILTANQNINNDKENKYRFHQNEKNIYQDVLQQQNQNKYKLHLNEQKSQDEDEEEVNYRGGIDNELSERKQIKANFKQYINNNIDVELNEK